MSDEIYEICTLPAGTEIDKLETGDPLTQKYLFELPNGVFKTLTFGPMGIELLEVATTPDFAISAGSKR